MTSTSLQGVRRVLLLGAVLVPLAATTACDLLKHKSASDDGGITVTTSTVGATTTAAPTDPAAVGTVAPITTGAVPPKTPMRPVKLPDGGHMMVPFDGGPLFDAAGFDAASLPAIPAFQIDAAAIPAIQGFDAASIPKTITIPSVFPTTLPGWPPPPQPPK
jgi:hypothetical protein